MFCRYSGDCIVRSAKKKPALFCRGQKAVETEENEEAQPAEDEEDQDDIQSNMNLFTEES
jgi:hypothetical protein